MTDQLTKIGRQLNATFLPNSLLRKSEIKLANTLAAKYQFQKTTGNAFIIIDPPEIKFAGYDLNKPYTATVKIINRAPIAQRIAILQPQQPCFSLKTNKKGLIASGMAETLTVVFRSNEHKYQHDVIRITTETDNFVIPLYAYPTLLNLRDVFPKVIDFGTTETSQPTIHYYPIKNTVPLNFEFEFEYQKECNQIVISPFKGVISAMETLMVQIKFWPKAKCTYSAEATLKIHQFDFVPLSITILGSGGQKMAASLSKRIKSSKLAPLKEGDDGKKSVALKRRPSESKQSALINLNATVNIDLPIVNNKLTPNATLRKNIRTNYPKLIPAKNTMADDDLGKTLNSAKIAEREYINRFGIVHDLDKQKQIKFASFLGDHPMSQRDIQFQREVVRSLQQARLNTLQTKCVSRYNPESFTEVTVQFKALVPKQATWDDKQNDEHHNRRKALMRFMQAGTKVILQLRLLKRLSKIKQFLVGCANKRQVRKKIQQSHAKAMDQQQGSFSQTQIVLDFNLESIHPSYFPLQFEDNNQEQKNILFQPEGKTNFIDLATIKEVKVHRMDQFKLAEMNFPSDYYNHTRIIPKNRNSGEEEGFFKSSVLPGYSPQAMTSIYSLPLKATAHHFIFDNRAIRRYNNYVSADEKDPEVYLQDDGPIQDEFQGWTGGEHEILKYKFTRNLGCEYQTFSMFNCSTDRRPLPALATLGQNLPHTIEAPMLEDKIDDGDSDQQNIIGAPVDFALKLLEQIQVNADLKDRRAKKIIRCPEQQLRLTIQKNLGICKDKATGEFIGKIREANRWVEHPQLRFLI